MKTKFLVLALVAGLAITSCNQVNTAETSTVDSTSVVVDTVKVETTTVK